MIDPSWTSLVYRDRIVRFVALNNSYNVRRKRFSRLDVLDDDTLRGTFYLQSSIVHTARRHDNGDMYVRKAFLTKIKNQRVNVSKAFNNYTVHVFVFVCFLLRVILFEYFFS